MTMLKVKEISNLKICLKKSSEGYYQLQYKDRISNKLQLFLIFELEYKHHVSHLSKVWKVTVQTS